MADKAPSEVCKADLLRVGTFHEKKLRAKGTVKFDEWASAVASEFQLRVPDYVLIETWNRLHSPPPPPAPSPGVETRETSSPPQQASIKLSWFDREGWARFVFRLGILAAIVALAFPPWIQTRHVPRIGSVVNPAGYHLILMPPEVENDPIRSVSIDFGRLVVELALIALVFGSSAYALRGQRPAAPRPNSAASGPPDN